MDKSTKQRGGQVHQTARRTSRGDRREDIFCDKADRQLFLAALEEACQKTDWQVHVYCSMRNHFHLVVSQIAQTAKPKYKWALSNVGTDPFTELRRISLAGRRLVGTDSARIVAEASRLLTDSAAYAQISQAPNPFGDGHAAERIVKILTEQL